MKTIITNKIKIYDPIPEVLKWCEDNLIIDNDVYLKLLKMQKEDEIRRKHVTPKLNFCKKKSDFIEVPFGCLNALWKYIKQYSYITDFSPTKENSIKNLPCPFTPYDYQEEAINFMIKAKGGILQASCGAGKTRIGIEIIHRLGLKFLWLCHTSDLLRQAKENFLELYPNMDIGLITEGKFEIGKDGAISTIQTLSKFPREDYENEFNIVISDECHHAAAKLQNVTMYERVLNSIKARYKYGLTATPFRQDTLTPTMYFNLGVNLNGECKPTYFISREKTNSLTAIYERFDINTALPPYYIFEGDGTIKYNVLVDYLCKDEYRNNVICNKTEELVKEGRKIAILTSRVEHCGDLLAMLKERSIKAVSITGKSNKKERERTLDNTDDWQVIISTTNLFKEGLDIKKLDTVFLVAPIKDEASVIQACGRCERKIEGKKQPIFLDACDRNILYCKNACNKRRKYINGRL